MQDPDPLNGNFPNLLDSAIEETEQLAGRFTGFKIYENILQQLLNIKNIVVYQNRKPEPDEVAATDLNAIALNKFTGKGDEEEAYGKLLNQIYQGFYHLCYVRNEAEVLEAAKEYLKKMKKTYHSIHKPEYKKDCEILLKGGGTKTENVWIIAYTYLVFQQEEMAFIYLETYSLKLIYINTKHGPINEQYP